MSVYCYVVTVRATCGVEAAVLTTAKLVRSDLVTLPDFLNTSLTRDEA